MSPRDDFLRLRDIVGAIDEICAARDRQPPDRWTDLQFAAIRFNLIVIGEAAYHLSADTRLSDAVWDAYIDLRHRVAHEYFRVDRGHVAELAGEDLDQLRTVCERLMMG